MIHLLDYKAINLYFILKKGGTMKRILHTIIVASFVLTISLAKDDDDDNEEEEYSQPVEEFFIAESVYPQEQFEVQFTFAPIISSESGEEKYQYPFSVEYGITDQLQIESGFGTSLDDIGFPDKVNEFEVGLKYSFMNINEKNIHAALGFEAEIPIDEEDEEVQYSPSFILAYDFLNKYDIQIFTNIGYHIVNSEEDEETVEEDEAGEEDEEILENSFDFNSGFFISFGDVTFVNEISIQKVSSEMDSEVYLTPGIVFSTPLEIEIGVAGSIGLNDHADSFRAILSFAYEL